MDVPWWLQYFKYYTANETDSLLGFFFTFVLMPLSTRHSRRPSFSILLVCMTSLSRYARGIVWSGDIHCLLVNASCLLEIWCQVSLTNNGDARKQL